MIIIGKSRSNWEKYESAHFEIFKILEAFQFSAGESKVY
jgi:hypothetical protein